VHLAVALERVGADDDDDSSERRSARICAIERCNVDVMVLGRCAP